MYRAVSVASAAARRIQPAVACIRFASTARYTKDHVRCARSVIRPRGAFSLSLCTRAREHALIPAPQPCPHRARPQEYVIVSGASGTIGISDHAQAQLGDVVYVGLPEVGAKFKKGDSMASVESVKAASDVYAPVSGTVTAVNSALSADPGAVNKAAETTAWFVKMDLADPKEAAALMDAAAYAKAVAAEKH